MRSLLMAAAGTLLLASPAFAETVKMEGTRSQSCALNVGTDGVLAIADNGTTFGTEGTGTAASITIESVGNNTVTVGAPTMTTDAADYSAGNDEVQIKYQGADALTSVNEGWTDASSTFDADTLASSTVEIDGRITNPSGFPVGTYTIQTVVTCSATIPSV